MKHHLAGIVLLLSFAYHVSADFTNPFTNLTQGQSLYLAWTPRPAPSNPYTITITLLNETTLSNSTDLFALKANISTAVIGNHFIWDDMPAPAPFVPTSRYQLEIRASDGAVVAGSGLFSISEQATQQGVGTAPDGTGDASRGGEAGRVRVPDKAAIAAGVVVSVVGVVTLAFLAWFLRRRRRQKKEELRVAKRLEFVIS
ncbi:hypothetical protein DL546_008330 [Coniochaeta pulveracea]|uniref:Epidermal growth factor receptor-like transmembrane-juxtamembrane segment domain-containing protein n=1 Tax=Coniochaeta pulveracea TaxID=177199 RepID=A0A420YG10_9PEZI|nr:hypothetical protein DL546_008330 [Coniochaeta pulveracea]